MHREAKNFSYLTYMFPAEVEKGNAVPFCFSSYTVNKCLFCGLFSTTFFTFLCSLLAISLFKIVPKCSANMLSNAPKCKEGCIVF